MVLRRSSVAAVASAAALVTLALLSAWSLAPAAQAGTSASGDRVWSFWRDSPTHALDAITDVAPGPSGTMYAAFDWGDDWADGSDMGLYRIRPDDATLEHVVWTGTYDNPDYHAADYPIALAVDPDGNAIVAGQTDQGAGGFDWLVVKWLRNSVRAWELTYPGPGGGDDWLTDAAVDNDGNVYVCGSIMVNATDRDLLVVKYRGSDGKFLWEHRYSGPKTSTGMDTANAIAVDAHHYVYVAGVSENLAHDQDAIVMRLKPDGTRDWIDRWGGAAHKADYAEKIALRRGAVYVAGETQPASGGTRVFAVKYGAGGGQSWRKTWSSGTGTVQQLNDLAVDANGNAIVAGRVLLGTPDAKGYLASWSTRGAWRWGKTYWNKATGESAWFASLAVDGQGRVWAGGAIGGSLSSQDALLVRFSAGGRRVWQASMGGTDIKDDWYNAISLWGSGGLFAGGALTTNSGDADTLATKYVR